MNPTLQGRLPRGARANSLGEQALDTPERWIVRAVAGATVAEWLAAP